MSYRLRRILSVFVLLVALPIYVVIVISVMALFNRPPFIIELIIYVALGVIWAFPLKSIFMGVGQEDPGKKQE
jgi:hypothetical protein